MKRIRHVGATAALILFMPGGASGALADSDDPATATESRADPDPIALTATQRQRRVEDAWLAQQLRAEARRHR